MRIWSLLLLCLTAGAGTAAWAQPVTQEEPAAGEAAAVPSTGVPVITDLTDWLGRGEAALEQRGVRYLVGVELGTKPDFFGPARHDFGLRPVLAVEWGRIRASTGGGHSLLDQGLDRSAGRRAGLEGVLEATDRFNLSLSLNLDRGRDAASTDRLQGMPDVPDTLRVRLRARYFVSERWSGVAAVSQDMLGKGGGLKGDLTVAYEYPIGGATRVTAAASALFGNGPYMRSQFGVPAHVAAGTDFAPYRPSADFYQSDFSLDVAHAPARHWVLFGGLRFSQLHGAARSSPLVYRSRGAGLSVGLAWRN